MLYYCSTASFGHFLNCTGLENNDEQPITSAIKINGVDSSKKCILMILSLHKDLLIYIHIHHDRNTTTE